MSVLFLAGLAGYFVTRAQSSQWQSQDLPTLPAGLLLSTAVLGSLSWAMHFAERSVKNNSYVRLHRGLLVALILSLVFLLVQVQNWRAVAAAGWQTSATSLYEFVFYVLTALHAAHVVFGIGPLVRVAVRAKNNDYSSSHFEGVLLARKYWDFLLLVWVVLLATLWFAQ